MSGGTVTRVITFRGGKLPAQPARPQLRFSAYATPALPAPPASVDWLSAVEDWPGYLNDALGDCTAAEVGHQIEQFTRYGRGATVQITDDDVLRLYETTGGYNPKKPSTDQGAYIQDVLGYWLKSGVAERRILAYASLDLTNLTEVHQAIDLFGSVNIGFNFPASAMDQFNAGEVWDVVKGSPLEGGHCVMAGGYKTNGNIQVVTWGEVTEMTPAFWKKYVDEAWVVITGEWFNTAGLSPRGFDAYALGQDYAALTGRPNPIPQPVDPQPDPIPTPGPADTDRALAASMRDWLTAKGL
jgi:hypothetical protein